MCARVCACTLKQVGHMVMLTSGSSERKYSHLSGRGQRLMSTSLLLMERSTKRLTLTGTNLDPPCCVFVRTAVGLFWGGGKSKHVQKIIRRTFFFSRPLCSPVQLVWPAGGTLAPPPSYLEAHLGRERVVPFIIQLVFDPQSLQLCLRSLRGP